MTLPPPISPQYPQRRIRLGILVPSSNTALEPLTQAILSPFYPSITIHFSRFPVTTISLSPTSLAQFSDPSRTKDTTAPAILTAALLLADAKVDVIGWSGTSAGWLGFEADEALCRRITEVTGGIPTTTSVLALNRVLEGRGVRRLGLVTPYVRGVQEKIVVNYLDAGKGGVLGVEKVVERHLEIEDNNDIADVTEEMLNRMVGEVVEESVDAVAVFCTNLSAAHLVVQWEGKYDVVVCDTVATVVWDMLRIVGLDTKAVTSWGRMFTKD